jgi:hypothetical protein
MELKFLTNNRLKVWQNTFQLFCKYNHLNYVGPFIAAGYSGPVFEYLFLVKNSGGYKTPDLVSENSSSGGWVVIDMTFNSKQKGDQLDSYKSIEPRSSSQYGMNFKGEPDVILSQLSNADIANCCQLSVDSIFSVQKSHLLTDQNLAKELENFSGTDLSHYPQISIHLLSEMHRPEIRVGLISIIMQLFNPESEGMTIDDMCKIGLDKMFEFTSNAARSKLCSNISAVMQNLLETNDKLKKLIQFKDGKYCLTEKGLQMSKNLSPGSKFTIQNELIEWANDSKPIKYAKPLTDFLID